MLQKNKALNSRKDIIISNSKEIWEPAPFYTCLILKILIIFKVLFLSWTPADRGLIEIPVQVP